MEIDVLLQIFSSFQKAIHASAFHLVMSLMLKAKHTYTCVYNEQFKLIYDVYVLSLLLTASPADANEVCYESCISLTRTDYANLMYTTLAEFPGTYIVAEMIKPCI